MKIAGFKKQSLIDYPGYISSVIFTQGCNFRCPFCHNPELVIFERFESLIDVDLIFSYLKKYSKILDAVCITGGEPTIQKDLPLFISNIKQLGLKIKLDSNGTNPDMLKVLIENSLIEFIAMDIKNVINFEKYNNAVGEVLTEDLFRNINKSISIILNSKIKYEFRTTVVRGIHLYRDIKILKTQFGNNYKIQNFNPSVVLNPDFKMKSFTEAELKVFLI